MIRKFPLKSDYLSTHELSKYINITPKGWDVRRSRKDGPISIKINNNVRYRWEDVLRWMEKESSPSIKIKERKLLIYKKFEKLKNENPEFSCRKISELLSPEFDLYPETIYQYLLRYSKMKPQDPSITSVDILPIPANSMASNDSLFLQKIEEISTPKKSNLSKLGDAISNVFKIKDHIKNKNL